MNDYTKMKKEEFEPLYFKTFKHFIPKPLTYGLEIKPGWYNLVWDLTETIDRYLKNNDKKATVILDQVKEKFGGLRYYYHLEGEPKKDTFKMIWGMNWLAESQSFNICQECGLRGELDKNERWYKTLCPKHKKLSSAVKT